MLIFMLYIAVLKPTGMFLILKMIFLCLNQTVNFLNILEIVKQSDKIIYNLFSLCSYLKENSHDSKIKYHRKSSIFINCCERIKLGVSRIYWYRFNSINNKRYPLGC